ncbi:hypothetical protein ACFO4N_15860 [Camelliibacillus cellulosilyticus]|uniref:DUF2651 domain-containing protein n=1 Tax=Camelliibacillus cellulosilyticus TaxID=2174486 RepID=A0ABV9GQB6_9BACL
MDFIHQYTDPFSLMLIIFPLFSIAIGFVFFRIKYISAIIAFVLPFFIVFKYDIFAGILYGVIYAGLSLVASFVLSNIIKVFKKA